MELKIKIKDKNFEKFKAFITTLDAAEFEIIEAETMPNQANEPTAEYGKKPRPSTDEIEAMIIKKALLDAKAIQGGEMKDLKSYDNYKDLIADLEAEIKAENEIHTN